MPPYQIIVDAGGRRYRFFCELSGGAVCTTEPLRGDSPEEERNLAWEAEGRKQFNQCHKCGKWVCDAMYNADVLQCVACAPWEMQPSFCPHCGTKPEACDTFCRECGARLQYGEVAANEG